MQKMKKSTKVLVGYSIVVTALAVLSIYQVLVLLDASSIVYAKNEPIKACPTPTEQLIERAYELREENKNYDLERYRQDAIREVNLELQTELSNSPFVDYEALEEEYGY